MTVTPDLIRVFENARTHDGEGELPPFTIEDRQAIDRYNQATEGIDDTFDCMEAEQFADFEKEHGAAAAREAARSYFQTLSRWYEALDALYGDLSAPTPEHGPTNTGLRLIQHEANRFFRTLNLTRREIVRWLLGTAGPCPDVDSGWLTFFDVPPRIELNGTALAESAG